MVGTYYGIATTRWARCWPEAFSAAVLGGIGNLAGGNVGRRVAWCGRGTGRCYIGEIMDLAHSGRFRRARRALRARGHFVLFGSNYRRLSRFWF